MGLIDIHTHIIPGVDDGAKNFEDSLATLKQLSDLGIDTIVATPHRRSSMFEYDEEIVRQNFNKLSNLIAENDLDIKIFLGAEYYFGPDLFDDINRKTVYTLGNSNYILVEFRSLRFTNQDKESLFRVITSGYNLIVAHIERNRFNSDSFSALEYLRDNSALFQCDIMSLSGLWGEQANLFMEELIKRNYVDVISTDVHCRDFEKELLIRGFKRLNDIRSGLKDRCMGESIKKRLKLL